MSTPAADFTATREARLIRQSIERFELDLRGLTVLTEAASGAYRSAPVLTAIAGAERVFAVTADSPYASADDVERETRAIAAAMNVSDRLVVTREKTPDLVGQCDIVTNTGFVRPITAELVGAMKPTAVIPLMWETWEFRPEDLDLAACRKKGILVLGTNEHEDPMDVAPYVGFLGMKLLFRLGLEGHRSRILLLGGQPILGGAVHAHLRAVGAEVAWFGAESFGAESFGAGASDAPRPYDDLAGHFAREGHAYDALIVAEHAERVRLLGADGLLTFDAIRAVNPALSIGVIAGNVDAEGLRASGLHHHPDRIRPFGCLSYQLYHLGPRPVLEHYAAGLKVGEAMARARLSNASVREAAVHALANAPALDFPGDDALV